MTYSKRVIILTAIFSVVLANATEIEDGNNTTAVIGDGNNTTVILMPEIPKPIQATTLEDQNITVEQATTIIATPATAATPTKVIIKLPQTEKSKLIKD